MPDTLARYTAFLGHQALATGTLADVARAAHRQSARDPQAMVAVYDHRTGRAVDLDLRGSELDVSTRYGAAAQASGADAPPPATAGDGARARGRPRLGVVAREVTLLPEHWAWLGMQPGGASVALRKLVLQAMRAGAGQDAIRHARERTYALMSALAGDLPGFEEATRALFAGDGDGFAAHIAPWPPDVRNLVARLSEPTPGAAPR